MHRFNTLHCIARHTKFEFENLSSWQNHHLQQPSQRTIDSLRDTSAGSVGSGQMCSDWFSCTKSNSTLPAQQLDQLSVCALDCMDTFGSSRSEASRENPLRSGKRREWRRRRHMKSHTRIAAPQHCLQCDLVVPLFWEYSQEPATAVLCQSASSVAEQSPSLQRDTTQGNNDIASSIGICTHQQQGAIWTSVFSPLDAVLTKRQCKVLHPCILPPACYEGCNH